MDSDAASGAQAGAGVQPLTLGIDPGVRETGWALLLGDSWVVGCGSWRTDPDESLPDRVADIGHRVVRVLCSHPVGLVALEKYVYQGPNSNWNAMVGTIRVLERVRAVCEPRGVPVVELTPRASKQRLGLDKKPSHVEVAKAFRNVPERTNEHGRDAIVLAWCGWESGR